MGQIGYIMPNNVYQDDSKKKVLSEKLDNSAELELLQLIANQDRDAFHKIFSLYYPRLQRFISRLTQCHELIEEVVNDVMFVVWQKAGDFKNQSRVSTWIFGIAYNKAQKSITSQSRHKSSPLEIEDIPEEVDATTPYTHLARDQELNQIQKSLEQLSLEHQSVVLLTYIYGYSYTEISEVMGCPVNTVKTRMFHARKNLQGLLLKFDATHELEAV